jgi:hypothetical protein
MPHDPQEALSLLQLEDADSEDEMNAPAVKAINEAVKVVDEPAADAAAGAKRKREDDAEGADDGGDGGEGDGDGGKGGGDAEMGDAAATAGGEGAVEEAHEPGEGVAMQGADTCNGRVCHALVCSAHVSHALSPPASRAPLWPLTHRVCSAH